MRVCACGVCPSGAWSRARLRRGRRPDSFADLAAKLLPTVVNIATSQTLKAPPQAAHAQSAAGLAAGRPVQEFPGPACQGSRGTSPRWAPASSSIPSGFIVTNNHVIEDADQITVTLQ